MAKLIFNENDLTIGDLEDFEDAVGIELTEALKPTTVKGEDGKPVRDDDGRPVQAVDITAKVLKGLVWIANRHDNPDFTLEDARNVKVTDLEIVRADDESDDPKVDPKD